MLHTIQKDNTQTKKKSYLFYEFIPVYVMFMAMEIIVQVATGKSGGEWVFLLMKHIFG